MLARIALFGVIAAVVGYLACVLVIAYGMLDSSQPVGLAIIFAIVAAVSFMGAIVVQRMTNREDDHYERTVDK